MDLIYWRDPKKSALVLAVKLAVLIAFATFSVLSCFAYAGMSIVGLFF